jgi:hypothetical protein
MAPALGWQSGIIPPAVAVVALARVLGRDARGGVDRVVLAAVEVADEQNLHAG